MYQRQGVAQQHEARRVVGQVLGDLVEALVHCPVLVLLDLLGLLIDQVCRPPGRAGSAPAIKYRGFKGGGTTGRERARRKQLQETHIQMTACGSEARDVPRRNLRNAALVSCEKTYSLASELCERPGISSAEGGDSRLEGGGGPTILRVWRADLLVGGGQGWVSLV